MSIAVEVAATSLPVVVVAGWCLLAHHRRTFPRPPADWPRSSADPPLDWDPATLTDIAAVVCPGTETARITPAPDRHCRCGYPARAWSIRDTGRVHIEHIDRSIGDCAARVCPENCGGLATPDGDPCNACQATPAPAEAAPVAHTRTTCWLPGCDESLLAWLDPHYCGHDHRAAATLAEIAPPPLTPPPAPAEVTAPMPVIALPTESDRRALLRRIRPRRRAAAIEERTHA